MTDVLLTLLPIPLSPCPHTRFSIFQLSPESLRQPSKPPLCPRWALCVQPRKSERFTSCLRGAQVWFPYQQHQHPPGIGEKCKFSGCIPDLLIQQLQDQAKQFVGTSSPSDCNAC